MFTASRNRSIIACLCDASHSVICISVAADMVFSFVAVERRYNIRGASVSRLGRRPRLLAAHRPDFPNQINSICPTGKSLPIFGKRVKPRNKKYFALSRKPNQRYITSIPSRPEGRIMIATNVGRVAVDAGSADSERHESVRQRRVVLTPRCWRQAPGGNSFSGRDGGKRAVLRGEHVISRKAIAQGMSDVLRCPVCSCAHSSTIAHETAGAARTRHSLRPLIWRGRRSGKPRAQCAARMRNCIHRHCRAKRRSNPCRRAQEEAQWIASLRSQMTVWVRYREAAAYWIPRLRGA